MMPILSGWARQTYATTLLRNVKGKMGTMPALRALKIILAYRHGAARSQEAKNASTGPSGVFAHHAAQKLDGAACPA